MIVPACTPCRGSGSGRSGFLVLWSGLAVARLQKPSLKKRSALDYRCHVKISIWLLSDNSAYTRITDRSLIITHILTIIHAHTHL